MKIDRSGNTLVMILVVSALILGGVVISMQYVGLTNQSSIKALKNSGASMNDVTALNILSGKLYLTKLGTELGPEPYPIESELTDPKFKPYLQVVSPGTATSSKVPILRVEGRKNPSGDCENLPGPIDINKLNPDLTDCKVTKFESDDSGLGSLEKGLDIEGWNDDPSKRIQTEFQKGFVGYPNVSQLTGNQFDNFLKDGINSSTPADLQTALISAKAVTFYKLTYQVSEPKILSSLEVSVGNTRAIIPIPAPPEPICKLTTDIDPRFIDCQQVPVTTSTVEVVGSHIVTTNNFVTTNQATSNPRTSLVICRCSNTDALYQPLEPKVDNCNGYPYNRGCITYHSTTTPLYRVNLGPRPGFDYRGRIYATAFSGEKLGQDEINGAEPIGFSQLLKDMGVSPTIPGTRSVTTNNPTETIVYDYATVDRISYKTVCNTRQTPECNGNCIEISGGRGVTTKLFADSILGLAQLSGDSFNNYKTLSIGRQSIKNILAFEPNFPNGNTTRKAVVEGLLLPPHNLYAIQGPRLAKDAQGNLDDEHGLWTIQGKVAGLKRASETTICGNDFTVYPPPPPHCVARVANGQILKGEATLVTLNCNFSDSGRVTGAKIRGGNSFSVDSFAPSARGSANYKMTSAWYQRTTDYQTETINITVKGLGGSINVSTVLGKVCPHNDPNYVSYIQGWGLPSAPLRRAAGYIGPWFVTQAANVWNPENSDLRWRSGRQYTADSVNHFNMVSWTAYNGGLGYWVAYGPKRSPSCSITQVGVRWSGCFTSDTRIRMADGREKLVSKISENDLIWNPLYQAPVKVTKVVKGPEKKALYQLRVAKNRLVVTEDHPFLTQRGWVRTDELSTKDLIMGEGLGKQILSVKKLSYKKPVDVFNFELDTDIAEGHMVIANGIPTGDLTTQVGIKQNRKNLP